MDDSKVLTVEEAGRWLGIGRSAAYEAVHRGDLPVIRIGKRIVVPIAALEEKLRAAGPLHAGAVDGGV